MEAVFLMIDRSGRGFSAEVKLEDIHDGDIKEWGETAEVGDSRYSEFEPIKYIRIR
jgi:hypothetical protein